MRIESETMNDWLLVFYGIYDSRMRLSAFHFCRCFDDFAF